MSLVVRIGANMDGFDAEARKFQGSLKSLSRDWTAVGERFQGVGKKMTRAVTLPLMAIGAASVKVGMDFEKSMSKVRTTVSDADANLDALTKTARHWGRNSVFAADEVAEAMSQMGLAGFKSVDILESIPVAVNLATSANMGLAEATERVTKTLNVFGLEGKDAARVADLMTSMNKTADASISDFAKSFQNAGSAINAYNVSLEDASMLITLMADSSLTGARAGTAMRSMLDDLAQACRNGNAEMKRLGVSFYDVEGNARPTMDVVNDLRSSMSGMSEEAKGASLEAMGLGENALKGLIPVLTATDDRVGYLADRFDNAAGSAQHYADIMSDNLATRMKILKNTFKDIGITIGLILMPFVSLLAEWLQRLGDRFENMSPAGQRVVVMLGAILAAVGPLLFIFGKLISTIGTVIGAKKAVATGSVAAGKAFMMANGSAAKLGVVLGWLKTKKVTTGAASTTLAVKQKKLTFATLKTTLATSKLGIALGAMNPKMMLAGKGAGLLKGAFSKLGTGISKVAVVGKAILKGLLAAVKVIMKVLAGVLLIPIKALALVVAKFLAIPALIIGAIVGIVLLIRRHWDKIKEFTKAIWEGIKNFISGLWEGIKNIASSVFSAIANFFSTIWENIRNVTTAKWEAITGAISAIWQGIKNKAKAIFNGVRDFFSNTWQNIKNTVSNIWNNIRNTVTNIWNGIKNTAQNIWSRLIGVIVNPVNSIRDAVSNAFSGLKNTAISAWQGMKSGIRTVINGIIRIINGFIGGFNTPARLLNNIPGVNLPQIPTVPMLAKGGYVFGSGQAIVGESGPELLSKTGASLKVTPLSAQEKSGGVGGALGGGITIENPTFNWYNKDDIRKTAEELTRQMMREGAKLA